MDGEVSIEQQYALKWNDFHTKVVSSFQNLRNDSDFVDVTIACDDCSFSAHKVILSACSPYFRKLLKENPCQHPIIIFRDVNKWSMENILLFMYNGEVQLEPNQFSEFLSTAKMLQIEGLTNIKNNFNPACMDTNVEPRTSQTVISGSDRMRKCTSPRQTRDLKNVSRKNCHPRSVSLDQDMEINDLGLRHENATTTSPENINTEEILKDEEPINPKLEPCEEIISLELNKVINSATGDDSEQNSATYNSTSNDSYAESAQPQNFERIHSNMEQQNYRSSSQQHHATNRIDSTQCPMCQRNYSSASNLRAHILNVHTPPSSSNWYQCSQCGKNCKTKHYLINHELRAHGIRQRGKRPTIFNYLNEDTM